MKKYLVICLDDDQRYVLATHMYFWTQEEALTYAKTIATSRCPFTVEVLRTIREPGEERLPTFEEAFGFIPDRRK